MKILSKYKDYYDYLQGIYGVDEKIVLDRRAFVKSYISEGKTRFFICGNVYEAWHQEDGKFIFGDSLYEVNEQKTVSKWSINNARLITYDKIPSNKFVWKIDKTIKRYVSICTIQYPDKLKLNEKHKCPILTFSVNNTNLDPILYPILEDVGLNKVIPAQDMYLMLAQWLAPKDNINSNQSDKEKIISNGFDLKTSFRNVK